MFQKPRNIEYVNKGEGRSKRGVFRWVILILLIALVVLSLLTACNIDDDRDICCEGICIDFRYSKGGGDLFPQFISSMRHFVFDESGILRYTIEGDKTNLQRLSFPSLPVGSYSLITLGNLGAATDLGNPRTGVTRKSEFLLKLNAPRADGYMANGDKLYWGVLDFVSEHNKQHRYLCDMSNIHCRLTVTVRWRDTQPVGDTPFTLQLREVPGQYALDNADAYAILVSGENSSTVSTDTRVVHRFPFVNEETSTLLDHRVEAPRLAGRVRAQFFTLRYTDDRIPLLRVYRDNAPVMKEIDLSKVFRSWKWEVSDNIEQDYEIEIEILDDGTVIVSSGGAHVLDWIDGGTV
ncbi:MAG: FimB/Mfa2 family fimbrial subunit [Bacteroidota bacterium]|nr:FimB/Mfa2 family fimbrial subunit [Bacteroidota bacterium]